MTLAAFLEHWTLSDNPFKGEEARQDAVFTRLSALPEPLPTARPFGFAGSPRPGSRVQHPDFEKIAGDFSRPSTSIVFGEKGSGKTAIRLQIAEHVAAYNHANPGARILLVPFDELNPVLDRFVARVLPSIRDKKAGPAEALKLLRLVDHLDGMLLQVVPRLVDALLEDGQSRMAGDRAAAIDLGTDIKKQARALSRTLKRDFLILQSVYDRAEGSGAGMSTGGAEERTAALRRRLGLRKPWFGYVESSIALLGWLAPLGVFLASLKVPEAKISPIWVTSFFVALGVWMAFVLKRIFGERLVVGRVARRLRKQIRTSGRHEASYADSVRELPPACRSSAVLPLNDSDDLRYAMVDRLRRALAPFGYAGAVVIVDRVDEPTVISGDADRMRSVVWPLLNNKFLQQDAIGIKLLLPIELRYLLFRESTSFFQEARLDKQCLVERLAWTGPMLYDLCTGRLNACRPAGAQPITLADLFAEDVTRQELIDALDQMHQPRDVFKLVYQCISEHCSNVTTDQAVYRVSKAVLDMVRKQQVERARQLYMGVRPA
ncbi:MAG: hypothetical protein ACT4PL_10200 [Phycisphaerales bacterium]